MLNKDVDINEIMEKLQRPFNPDEIEWKVQNKKSGLIAPFVTNRAIQNRLDEIFTPFGWRNEYKETSNGVICGISIYYDKQWITKFDGADITKYTKNSVSNEIKLKAVLSDSMKRCATQWGIGRYLYKFPRKYIKLVNDKIPKGTNLNSFIPDWAIPETIKRKNVLVSKIGKYLKLTHKNDTNSIKEWLKDNTHMNMHLRDMPVEMLEHIKSTLKLVA